MAEGYWQRRTRTTSRRGFVRGLAVGAAGLSGAMLLACGGSKEGGDEGGGGQGAAPPVGASVPTAEAVAAVPRGGTLKIGMAAQPIYDPHFGFGGGDHQWLYPVFDSLVAYNSKGLLDQSMSVAREWEYVEPTKIVLKLRPDAKIHDTGEPVNAELVKWNLARAMSPRALPRNDLAAISRVDVVDDQTVALTLSTVSAPLLTNLGDRGGFIVSRQMVEKHGDNARLYPTGSGMFRVVDWKQDAHIHLEAVKNHWRKDAQGRQMPYTDRIQFQIIPEATVLTAALEGGDVDVAAPSTSETTRLLKSPGRLKSVAFNGSSMTSFSWNHASPPFDNVNFRRGFASAMDRQTWIKNFQTGREEECRGVLHPANWAFSKEVEGWKYDPQKAAEYLRASGIPRDQWVVKFHPADAVDDTELYWEQNLGQIGIKFQWARPERGGDGSSSFYLTGWSMRVDPDANVSAYYVKDGAYNSGGAPTPLTEDLIVKARETLDINERKSMYTEIQKRALDQVYSHVLMCYTISTAFAQPRVGNLSAYYGGEGKPRYGELWVE
jgi:ABC-type transport system substrate-binding protein